MRVEVLLPQWVPVPQYLLDVLVVQLVRMVQLLLCYLLIHADPRFLVRQVLP